MFPALLTTSCDLYWKLLDPLTDEASAVPLHACDLEAGRMQSVPCTCCICGSVVSRTHSRQAGERGCLQQAIQLLGERDDVRSIYTGFGGTAEYLLPAHSLVVEITLVNQWYCHHGVFLSSVIYALSLPLSRSFFLRFLLPQILYYSLVAFTGFLKQKNKATQVRN